MNRRSFIAYCGATLVSPSLLAVEKATPVAENKNAFADFDKAMEKFMAAKEIPGGALAVVKENRLVYARGYGWADQEKKLPVKPESLFRIASLSKPITAVGVLKLAERGKLELDQPALDFIKLRPILAPDTKPDPRWQKVTIRHLLQHTGGWDRSKSYDPMFRPELIARAAGVKPPADRQSVIRYMLGQPLDFDPGTMYAYSNFGYCLLGRIIETISGKPYEHFIKDEVLAPMGIRNMRIGKSQESLPSEVRYYDKNAPGNSVFPDVTGKVSLPYGGFYLEAMDSHGGWIASAVDLARFAAALHDQSHSLVLKPESFKTMYAPPEPPVSRTDGKLDSYYYGCGWSVKPAGKEGKATYSHNGSLTGTSTLLVRRWDGLSWVVLFNLRLGDRAEIEAGLHRAADSVETWPSEDLFLASGDRNL